MSTGIAVIAWTAQTSRARELAVGFGGTGVRFGHFGMRGRATAPLRYLVNSVRTVAWLARHRPEVVVVQNPPLVLSMIAMGWARITATRFVLDSHPVAFGRKDARGAYAPLHRWLARRAALVLVTVEELAEEVRAWGGRAVVLHEAPPEPLAGAQRLSRPPGAPPTVLFVCVFADDEPVEAVVEAARRIPQVRMRVTGRLDLAQDRLSWPLPDNVELAGFLGPEDYRAALLDADVVLALTKEPTSVMRAGYEAVYAGRPLVVSDWPNLQTLFPYAVPASNDADGIARAVELAIADIERHLAAADRARDLQARRWDAQLAELRSILGGALPG